MSLLRLSLLPGLLLCITAGATACGGESGLGSTADSGTTPDSQPPARTVPVLGAGSHGLDRLELKTIADGPAAGLSRPTDVAFHSKRPNELWVTSQQDNSIVLIFDVGTPKQTLGKSAGSNAVHFLAQPSALAFSDNGNVATAQETDQITQPSTPPTFMGPTLWSTDMTIFDGGYSGHLDMLHNSPLGGGIAWEVGNAFWVFDGFHGAITRYDFKTDHGAGGADHSDGVIARYAQGQVKRVPGVCSHLEFDHTRGLLWVVDTGHNRIATLDPALGTKGAAIQPNYDGAEQYAMDGTSLETVIDGEVAGLQQPSGIALREDLVFVTDSKTGRIWAFETNSGEAIDWLDTGLGSGSLAGLTFDGAGQLYFVDMAGDRVLRLAPR